MDLKPEKCIRKRVEIEGENFYLIIGKDFLQCTVPRENDPYQSKIRMIVETICAAVSEVRKNMNKGE